MPTFNQLLASLGKQITLVLGWGILLGAEFLTPVPQTYQGERVILFEVDRYPREEMAQLLSRSVAMEVRYLVLMDKKLEGAEETEVVRTLKYRSLSASYLLKEGEKEITFRSSGEALKEFFTLRVPQEGLKGCFVKACFRLPESGNSAVQQELWPVDPRSSWRAGE